MKRALAALLLGTVVLSGCDSPQRTIDSLRKELMEFKAAPDDAKEARIEADFAKLENQIAVVQQKGDPEPTI